MCKFDAEINGAAFELANEALSFVPAVERVLVKAREFVTGAVDPALKLEAT
jgi:hypothetical protein